MSTAELVTLSRDVFAGRYDEDGDEVYETIDRPVCFVGVYAITRHYGGGEEGGWWYNWAEHVLSIPLIEPGSAEEIEQIKTFLSPRFEKEGDIYSVNGGVEYRFSPEINQGEDQSEHRPRYE